jgi:hypothetical protein
LAFIAFDAVLLVRCPGSGPLIYKEESVQVLSNGQQIRHQQYGIGVVTESDAERTAIDFDNHGRKVFITNLMTAELIGDAPANPTRSKRRSRKNPKR